MTMNIPHKPSQVRPKERSREETDGMEAEMDGLPWMKEEKIRRECGASERL